MIIAPSLKLPHTVRKNSNTYRLLKWISARLAKELIQGTDPVISPQSFFYTTLQGTCHDNCHFLSSLESWSGLEIEREAGRLLPHCGGLAALVEALKHNAKAGGSKGLGSSFRPLPGKAELQQGRLSADRRVGRSESWSLSLELFRATRVANHSVSS